MTTDLFPSTNRLIPMSAQPNRWTIAAAAVGVHISIGSIYAYSVFKPPPAGKARLGSHRLGLGFQYRHPLPRPRRLLPWPTVERIGPRKSGFLSASLFTLGLLISALAVHLGWLPLFYLGFGVIGGTGIGVGYICPVSTLVKWFPDRRGLATGLAIMGFGFGSLVAGSLIQFLITNTGLTLTFLSLAALYGTVMVLSASKLRPPPVGWMAEEVAAKKAKGGRGDLSDINSFQALKTVRFYFSGSCSSST